MADTSRHPELRVGPLDPREHIDPADPGEVAQFVGPTGVLDSALDLVHAQQARYSGIGPALALPRIESRSHPDYVDLEEVQKVAKIDPKEQGQVVGAAVRGDMHDTRRMIVTYVVEGEDGRHSKGAVPYEKLSKSRKLFDDRDKSVDPYDASLEISRLQREIDRLKRDQKS